MQYSFWVKVFLQCSLSLSPCDLVHGNIAQISFFVPLFRRIHSNNIFVFGWSEREKGRCDENFINQISGIHFPLFGFIAPDYFLSSHRLSSSLHPSSDALLWELSTFLWITLFWEMVQFHTSFTRIVLIIVKRRLLFNLKRELFHHTMWCDVRCDSKLPPSSKIQRFESKEIPFWNDVRNQRQINSMDSTALQEITSEAGHDGSRIGSKGKRSKL